MRDNGFSVKKDPVLQPLNNIVQRDAILDLSDPKKPKEPAWPRADVIVGNPPFLGGKLLRRDLGDDYVDTLFKVYDGRVPREADLVCYWFEKSRDHLGQMMVNRVGLLGTQGIRGGANRRILERIKKTGDIFFAVSDREWALEGAMVHVSMVGFDKGRQASRMLDGHQVPTIHSDLTTGADVTKARRLSSNKGIAFMGDSKGGDFDISDDLAKEFLQARNPHAKPNRDVVKPWVNGSDIFGQPRGMWLIDFGTNMREHQAALYEAPFEYVRRKVKPERASNKRASYRLRWWIHVEPRPRMRRALTGLSRFIATTRHSKHRMFVWLSPDVIPDSALIVFAREDDYFLGVLHSRIHEVWSRQCGTQVREEESGARYTPTTTFETFPFPWPIGKEPSAARSTMGAISRAAKELNDLREQWLGPIKERSRSDARTLTMLYNENPTWLKDAHRKLDHAVLDAYGWPKEISDQEILERLLELNAAHSHHEW